MVTKPANIKPLAQFAKFARVAIVCKSGFGKTVFAGSAPRALFLTTDPEGTISAKEFGSDAEEWRITSWQDFLDAYAWLRDGGHTLYDWVIIDNITEAQNFCMEEAMEVAVARNDKRSKYVPDKYEYQVVQNAIIETVKKFHDLPMHVLWTCHRKGMEDGDGQEYYSAAIQGKQGEVAETILGYMNIIGMGEVKELEGGKTVRRIYFTHTGPYRGKDRFNKLGNFKDDLTVPKMMSIVKGGVKPPARSTSTTKKAVTKKVPAKRVPAKAGR